MYYGEELKKYQIVYLDLGQKKLNSSIQVGKRYAIIVSNDKANKYSSVVTAIPLTSVEKKVLPTHLDIPSKWGLTKKSILLAEQKKVDEERRWKLMHKSFEINNKQIEVNCGNSYINEDEIKMTVRDILDTTKGKTIVKNREFNVGCCSDVSFEKIVFKGCRDDVLYFDIK